jgi:hypothetical protein
MSGFSDNEINADLDRRAEEQTHNAALIKKSDTGKDTSCLHCGAAMFRRKATDPQNRLRDTCL